MLQLLALRSNLLKKQLLTLIPGPVQHVLKLEQKTQALLAMMTTGLETITNNVGGSEVISRVTVEYQFTALSEQVFLALQAEYERLHEEEDIEDFEDGYEFSVFLNGEWVTITVYLEDLP